MPRRGGPEQVAQIDMRPPVDVASASNASTQTYCGVADRSGFRILARALRAMCPPRRTVRHELTQVCPTSARKTTADADSAASQSQDYGGWRWTLSRFKSSRPDCFSKEALRRERRRAFSFQGRELRLRGCSSKTRFRANDASHGNQR